MRTAVRFLVASALTASLVLGVRAAGAAPAASLASPAAAAAPRAPAQDESVEELVAQLRREKERAEPALFAKLVRTRSAEAGRALVEVYGEMATPGGRLRVITALPPFADLPEVRAAVLDHLTHVATNDPRRFLRLEALAALSKAAGGRERLRDVVDAPAEDQIRIEAMRLHVQAASQADVPWYRSLWKPDEAEKSGKGGKGDKGRKGDEALEPRRLIDVARLAFEGLVPHLTDEELVEALASEGGPNLRRALGELRSRRSEAAAETAERIFGTLEADPLVRLEAGRLMFELRGAEFVAEAADVGANRQTAVVLRDGLAELVARHADEKALAKFAKQVGKGKPNEKIFHVLATLRHEDEKLAKELLELLEDKDLEVRLVAMHAVAVRGERDAVPLLEELLAGSEDERELVGALEAVSLLRDGEIAWSERVRGFAASERPALRHAALRELVRRSDAGALATYAAALEHADWATRLAAIEALVALRDAGGVPLLIARLPREEGRLATAVAEALFALTGQNFQKRAAAWEAWWADNGAGFVCISEQERRALEREATAQRLELTTGTQEFFGIEIDSHRVAFVLDVSGSMEEKVAGQYARQLGEMRITAAKKELTNFLDGLAAGAWFNLLPFNDRVLPWREQMVRNEGEAMAEAKEFVADLVASGGTNIHGALEQAFADPETDTIVLLSDGDPTAGDVTDINEIRRLVRQWNEHRGIVVHTVQIGATFELLEWLAADSGGSTALIP